MREAMPVEELTSKGFQVYTTLTLLNTPLVAIYDSREKYSMILVAPTNIDDAGEYTVKQLEDDLNKHFNVEEDIVTKKLEQYLPKEKLEGVKAVSIKLTSVYYYQKKFKKETSEDKNISEYAFGVEMNLEPIGDFGMAKLEKIGFSIWNTNRRGVVDALNLLSADERVERLNQPKKAIAL